MRQRKSWKVQQSKMQVTWNRFGWGKVSLQEVVRYFMYYGNPSIKSN